MKNRNKAMWFFIGMAAANIAHYLAAYSITSLLFFAIYVVVATILGLPIRLSWGGREDEWRDE